MHDSVRDQVPYWVIVVEYPESNGVRLASNLLDRRKEPPQIGQVVQLTWDAIGDSRYLPRFSRPDQP
jgi:uncharacterized OB-fold protein